MKVLDIVGARPQFIKVAPILRAIQCHMKFGEVVLEDGCDIVAGAIILPGVKIGEGAILGADAVVTRDIPPYEVWAGVPARKVRER